MGNSHRIMWLDNQIRGMRYPNRNTLCEKFEISVRQAQRDIDYLKNSLGAPICYHPKHRGYYYEHDSYFLPNVYINEMQQQMLRFLAYRYENYSQTPLVREMSELLNKLIDNKKIQDDIPVFDLHETLIRHYYTIYHAIQSRNSLKITYEGMQHEQTELLLDPYKLFYKYHTDHVVGRNHKNDTIVELRLDRIVTLSVLDNVFKISDKFDESSYAAVPAKCPFVARIRFNAQPVPLPHKLNALSAKQIDALIYDLEFMDVNAFVAGLAGNAGWQEILHPKWLKQRIIDHCNEIMRKL